MNPLDVPCTLVPGTFQGVHIRKSKRQQTGSLRPRIVDDFVLVGGCRKSRDGQGVRLLPIPSAERPTEDYSYQFRLFASPPRGGFALSRSKGVSIRASLRGLLPRLAPKLTTSFLTVNLARVFSPGK